MTLSRSFRLADPTGKGQGDVVAESDDHVPPEKARARRPFPGYEAVLEGGAFDPPDADAFARLSVSNLRQIVCLWDNQHLEIMAAVERECEYLNLELRESKRKGR